MREAAVQRAAEIVRWYAATMRVDPDSKVEPGKLTHVDGSETDGYYVTAHVFVTAAELEGD